MNLLLQRFSDNNGSTLGLMYIDRDFECYTLEDTFHIVKIKGETRIPAGKYRLGIRDELTPLTKKYREKFQWFENHIEIKDVPNYTGIYIHIGNYDEDTNGCILLGNTVNNNKKGKGVISYSTDAFKDFYYKIFPLLKGGEDIWITIMDEINIL